MQWFNLDGGDWPLSLSSVARQAKMYLVAWEVLQVPSPPVGSGSGRSTGKYAFFTSALIWNVVYLHSYYTSCLRECCLVSPESFIAIKFRIQFIIKNWCLHTMFNPSFFVFFRITSIYLSINLSIYLSIMKSEWLKNVKNESNYFVTCKYFQLICNHFR